jgi:hypothetical protein
MMLQEIDKKCIVFPVPIFFSFLICFLFIKFFLKEHKLLPVNYRLKGKLHFL